VERVNPAIQTLYGKHVLSRTSSPRILDIGCGCGVNAREFKRRTPQAYIVGIEPNPRAAELAAVACDEIFQGMLEDWMKAPPAKPFDLVVLSDVLEHIADPVSFLRALAASEPLRGAQWIVSVPNYAVWYNRIRTLLGIHDYGWSGIWDRTHVRFFTRDSIRHLLSYCGFELVDDTCSPSIVQSAAPLLRKSFERDVREGDHLVLAQSKAYAAYQKAVEPAESLVCRTWPALLGFQIVHLARLK
jgi:SAM-dependent methyltransferase